MFQKQLKIDSRARDFKGVKVGKLLPLKIISNVSTKNNSGYLWECKCDCGNIITVPSWDLSKGRRKSCGCARYKDITGKKSGELTAIKLDSIRNNQAYWLCKCSCGNYKLVKSCHISGKKIKSCGCMRYKLVSEKNKGKTGANRKEKGLARFNSIFNGYKNSAKKRGLKFVLSKEQFLELTQKNCYYCGKKPINVSKSDCNYGEFIYNGIDRLDNKNGYIIENCVSCCIMCNKAKRDISEEEFKEWIYNAYQHLYGGD